ncbi:hypothetical protein E2C01_064882 [Portunus trituberculatus]|uniref:Uncharacterized protein n=1 Tax=Portunus trituberculatus TaxID=210409 RepID=A0A5B7HPL7_PORTR|nr:hypothetical protein [Portunus trituberculatus]
MTPQRNEADIESTPTPTPPPPPPPAGRDGAQRGREEHLQETRGASKELVPLQSLVLAATACLPRLCSRPRPLLRRRPERPVMR